MEYVHWDIFDHRETGEAAVESLATPAFDKLYLNSNFCLEIVNS